MKFVKMEALGNDYVLIDLFQEQVDDFVKVFRSDLVTQFVYAGPIDHHQTSQKNSSFFFARPCKQPVKPWSAIRKIRTFIHH